MHWLLFCKTHFVWEWNVTDSSRQTASVSACSSHDIIVLISLQKFWRGREVLTETALKIITKQNKQNKTTLTTKPTRESKFITTCQKILWLLEDAHMVFVLMSVPERLPKLTVILTWQNVLICFGASICCFATKQV